MKLAALLENNTFRKLLLDVQQKLIEALPDEFEVELKHGVDANSAFVNDRDTIAVTGPFKSIRAGEALHIFIASRDEVFSKPEREKEEGRFVYTYWPKGAPRFGVTAEEVIVVPFNRQNHMIADLVTLITRSV